MINTHGNGHITFSPAIQLLNIHQLDDMLKWFIDFSQGSWGKDFDVSWMSQVWYPKICNYDVAPREYRLKVADKLEQSIDYLRKHDGIGKFYMKQIENLRTDQLEKVEELELQRSFIRYNDTQDRHRKGQTWRNLLPDLEDSLTKSLN